VSTIEIDQTGLDRLGDFVRDRVGGRLAGQMVDDARRGAPVDSGALKSTGFVTRMGPELWRISFGRGLPDGRAVYQEVGTGPHFYQPTFVDTDFSPLRGEHPGNIEPRAYIRFAVYRERSL
jgi:hypothetical protein